MGTLKIWRRSADKKFKKKFDVFKFSCVVFGSEALFFTAKNEPTNQSAEKPSHFWENSVIILFFLSFVILCGCGAYLWRIYTFERAVGQGFFHFTDEDTTNDLSCKSMEADLHSMEPKLCDDLTYETYEKTNVVLQNNSPLTNVVLQNNSTLYNAIVDGGTFQLNSEETISSDYIFVRLRNSEFNYSENPSFISGSTGEVIYDTFINQPQVYVTTIGMYNDANELLAVSKLSRPLIKDFTKEALVRVKLDF